MDRKIERKVSLNDFLKEQWKPQPSTGPTLHTTPEHPPTITTSKATMGLRRQASFPSHERQVSKDSKASDRSDRTVIQKLLNRKASNSSLPPTATAKIKQRDVSLDSTGSDQTVINRDPIPQPK